MDKPPQSLIRKKLRLTVVPVATFLIFAPQKNALANWPTMEEMAQSVGQVSGDQIILKLLFLFVCFTTFLMFCSFIYGVFLWMTASSNEPKTDHAREKTYGSLRAIIFIFCLYGLILLANDYFDGGLNYLLAKI